MEKSLWLRQQPQSSQHCLLQLGLGWLILPLNSGKMITRLPADKTGGGTLIFSLANNIRGEVMMSEFLVADH